MLSQYGVRMYSEEFREMTCDEFFSLLAGLGPETPLGNLVQIRSENNPEILKNFNSAQKRIRDEWRQRHPVPVNTDEEAHKAFLAQIQGYFAAQ